MLVLALLPVFLLAGCVTTGPQDTQARLEAARDYAATALEIWKGIREFKQDLSDEEYQRELKKREDALKQAEEALRAVGVAVHKATE
jgi:Sec-independent protein translocase protein TatA